MPLGPAGSSGEVYGSSRRELRRALPLGAAKGGRWVCSTPQRVKCFIFIVSISGSWEEVSTFFQ